jgi:N-acetylmuramoyl-L-alanine amidase CwlD
MRTKTFTVLFLTLLIGGCTYAGVIPPQDVSLDPEPRSIALSEMAAELGWTYERGPGAYQYTMQSPRGHLVTFEEGSDRVIINTTRWQQERDATPNKFGNDLVLPESTYNFVCKRFGMYHLVRGPQRKGADYHLKAIETNTPEAPKAALNGPLKGITICVDAGHGGPDQGGSAFGIMEKDIVLPVSLKLRDMLAEAGATVLMTRTTDVYPDLDRRCEIANEAKADLFVSVHANIAPNSDVVTGFEVFYKGGMEQGARLAKTLVASMDRVTDSPNRGAKVDPRGLRVLEKTHMPAVLVELGVLSNAEEGKRLTTKSYQDAMAKALYEGITQYCAKGRASVSK